MLNAVRKGAKTWVAKIILSLLVGAFALWGIGDVVRGSMGRTAIEVGDQEISAQRFGSAYQRETAALSQQLGQPVDSVMARQIGLDQQVIGRLATEATLDHAMAELSLSAPDEAVARVIREDPSFRGPDGFDTERYKYALGRYGYRVEDYEEETRRALARNQLIAALGVGAPPAGSAEAIFAWRAELRRFDYVTLTVEDHTEPPAAPDEAALSAYHQDHPELFSAAETRDVVYLQVSIDELAKTIAPDEDALRALYDNRSAVYNQPERRALYQIVYDSADEAAADFAKLQAGALDFDGLLAARGETRADVSLGEVAREEVAEATAEAAFALSAPGVVGPVDTGFGFALIDVAAITPAAVTPFADARAELAADLRREAALDAAPGLAGEIEDARAGGATLEEAAEKVGLEVRRALVTRDNGAGINAPEFVTEVFAAHTGEERDIHETAGGDYFVIRLESVTDAQLRPLDEVRDRVIAAWTAQTRRDALEARARAALERVESGAPLTAIAEDAGVEVLTAGPNTRNAGWSAIPPALVTELFGKPMGGAGYGPSAERPNAFVVAQVAGIETPAPTGERAAEMEALKAQLGQMVGQDTVQLYVAAKQEQAGGVMLNKPLIDSLLSSGR